MSKLRNHWDYSSTPMGETRDPSGDIPVLDAHGRWVIALDGNPETLQVGIIFRSEALAANYLRRRQAIHDGQFGLLDGLWAEADELRRQVS